MKLYEINKEIETLMNMVDENGELSEEIFGEIANLSMFENEKIDNIGCYIKTLIAESEAIKAEKMALAKRQSLKENHADRLKAFLNNYMAENGKTKFETPRCVISFRKSTSCNVFNEDLIPKDFREPQPDKIMKSEIKEALKNGQEIPGAELSENQNIQIK